MKSLKPSTQVGSVLQPDELDVFAAMFLEDSWYSEPTSIKVSNSPRVRRQARTPRAVSSPSLASCSMTSSLKGVSHLSSSRDWKLVVY